MADAMRVFLAVDLRDTLGPAAQAWGRTIAERLGSRDAASLSWVPASRIHVTLHFFGALDAAAISALQRAMGDRVPASPFDLVAGAGGTFPATGRPRVLWLGFAAGAEALTRLQAWLEPRIAGIGQPDRHATFQPHVTVARVRRDAGRSLGRPLREAAAQTPVPAGRIRVDAVTLFESVPSPKGPEYVPIVRVPFAGGAPSG
jgi:RNA 2',3'-cyclic 3'-phosphodiesterase